MADPAGNLSPPATVTVVVASDNDLPVANADSGTGFGTVEDAAFVTADVSGNDTDIEDGTVFASSVILVADATSGTAVSNGDGTFTYTPNPNSNGSDSFAYKVTDSDGDDSLPATVTVVVTSDNDLPVANPDSGAGFGTVEDVAFTTADVTVNDTDIEDGTVAGSTVMLVDAATKRHGCFEW